MPRCVMSCHELCHDISFRTWCHVIHRVMSRPVKKGGKKWSWDRWGKNLFMLHWLWCSQTQLLVLHDVMPFVLSCHVMSRHLVISCHVTSCYVMSLHDMMRHVLSFHVICHHVLSWHFMSGSITMYHHVMSLRTICLWQNLFPQSNLPNLWRCPAFSPASGLCESEWEVKTSPSCTDFVILGFENHMIRIDKSKRGSNQRWEIFRLTSGNLRRVFAWLELFKFAETGGFLKFIEN